MRVDFHLHYVVTNESFVPERLRLMDEADVRWSVLHPLPHLHFMDGTCGDNEEVLQVVRAYPDRFVGSIYVDPRQPDWKETLDRYAGEGFRCVKMWPPVGFYPDEPQFAPIYEYIQELVLPVLFHVGLTGIGREYDSKYADPIRIEPLLRRYPRITFLLAHWGGLGTFQMSWALMKANDNVFLDSSARVWSWPGEGLYRLYATVTPVDFRRLVWGTDNLETPAAGIRCDRELLRQIGKEEFADAYFGETARRVLRLP